MTGAVKIDLARILRRNHPSALARRSRACHVRRQQRSCFDILRRQQSVRAHLAAARAADLAQHQRAGRHYPIQHPRRPLVTPRVPEQRLGPSHGRLRNAFALADLESRVAILCYPNV
jgi:hypothetical protein